MQPKERPIVLHIATSSDHRAQAFATLLSPDRVKKVPFRFTEEIIHKPVNSSPSEWPFEVAKEKALQDLAGILVQGVVDDLCTKDLIGEIKPQEERVIRLYSDTVQVSYIADAPDSEPIVLEKPLSVKQWLIDRERGALAQSGKHFEICTALTGIDLTNPHAHPAAILVRIAGKMKPYKLTDVISILEQHGNSEVNVAGGISMQNGGAMLYDKKSPLRAYIQLDPNSQPQLLFELPTWEHLDKGTLQRFVYGALPEALDALIEQIDHTTYIHEFSEKKE